MCWLFAIITMRTSYARISQRLKGTESVWSRSVPPHEFCTAAAGAAGWEDTFVIIRRLSLASENTAAQLPAVSIHRLQSTIMKSGAGKHPLPALKESGLQAKPAASRTPNSVTASSNFSFNHYTSRKCFDLHSAFRTWKHRQLQQETSQIWVLLRFSSRLAQ